jgi:hypothetical protein
MEISMKVLGRATTYVLTLAMAAGLAGTALGAAATGVAPAGANSSPPPKITITADPYHNGETISLSVGPNKFFRPYGRVNLLECADPKGKTANLPRDESTCDGNTIQGNTILVKKNGSFSEKGYQLFALPSTTLGELANGQPVCNPKHTCVLYVGEDQTNFNAWPKEFSPPFVISMGKTK